MADTPYVSKLSREEKERKAQEIGPLVTDLRSRRKPIEQDWLNYHAAWRGKHTRTQFKSEMFSHFVPAGRRTVERAVIRTAQMLIPSSEFFEVYPGREMDDRAGDQAESIRSYFSYLFDKRIKVYPFVRSLARTFFLYGRAVSKVGLEVIPSQEMPLVFPTVRAVDPFVFYVWPETASSLEQAQILVEDNMMPWSTYETHVKNGVAEEIKHEELSKPDWPSHAVQRLGQSGITDPSATGTGIEDEKKKNLVGFVALSEVWCRKESGWQQYWLVWNVPDSPRLVRYNEKPFPVPPYRMSIARQLPGEHYTTGMMDDIEPMQVLLNDQVNLMLEGQAMAMSGVAAINPDLVARADTIKWRPRAKWLMDPAGVKFLEPPDTTKSGLQGIQFTLGMIDSFSGSNPMAEGQPTRNMPRAGFAVSSLLNLSLSDLKDAAQMIENDILTPVMGDLYRITKQFVPKDQLIMIPGSQHFAAQTVTAKDLVGDWDFKWVGSIQSQDFQVRAQRLVATLGMLAKLGPVVLEDLQMRGKRINWEAILKRVWRDGLGERGADSIIEDINPEMQGALMLKQMMAQMQKGGGTGGSLPGVPESQAALEQSQGRSMTETSLYKM